MFKRMKRSESILAITLLLIVSSVVGHAFYIKNNTTKRNLPCTSGLELGKGQFFEDECFLNYSHLVVTVPDVELVSGQSDFVKVEGYENAWWVQNMEVRNDTLFISKIDECMPRYVTDESINAVKYFVAADNLKSITVGNKGSIVHPLKPYGSYEDGRPAYKKYELERHTFRFDEITINLIGNGFVNLIIEGGDLNMNFRKSNVSLFSNSNSLMRSNSGLSGNQVLIGTIDKLNVENIEKNASLFAENLDAKEVYINPLKNKENHIIGRMEVSVSEKLEAYLYSDLDVTYKGSPEVLKEETGYGRLMNVNDIR